MDLVIRRARLLEGTNLQDIGIENGVIKEIAPSIGLTETEEYDAAGKFVSPGFVDAHAHLDKSLTVSTDTYQHGGILDRVMQLRKYKIEATPDDFFNRAVTMAKLMAKQGVLYLRTNVDVDLASGLKGIEGVLRAREYCREFMEIQVFAFAQEGILEKPEVKGMIEEALKMGADGVGGHTSIEPRGIEHIDQIFHLAQKYSLPVDFHVDENADPANSYLEYLMKKTQVIGYQGKVNAIHCASLGLLEESRVEGLADKMAEAGLNSTVCPGTIVIDCPLAPVKTLLGKNVNVSIGSDNTRDPINPLGTGNPLVLAVILSYLQKFLNKKDLIDLYSMLTFNGAKTLGLAQDYGIAVGKKADLIVLDCSDTAESILKLSAVMAVIKNGRVIKKIC